MWYHNRFFKYASSLILILLIIFLFGKIDFFLEPFKKFIAILFLPFLFSGLLYYLLRPLVRLGTKYKIPKTASIIIIFLFIIILFGILGTYAGALIFKQVNELGNDLPNLIPMAKDKASVVLNNSLIQQYEEQITGYIQKIFPQIWNNLGSFIATVTGIASILVVVPFIVFYMLRDDKFFVDLALKKVPSKYKKEVTATLKETDKTLSAYIIGQATVAFIIGLLMYIGYLITGLNYSLLLALFAMITSFIPLLGAIIGVIPALLVGLATSPFMCIKVLIVVVLVQQLEGNFISPGLIGKKLDIHPLTIILIFLVAASLYGFIGMLIAVPFYAVLKVMINGGIKIFKIWHKSAS